MIPRMQEARVSRVSYYQAVGYRIIHSYCSYIPITAGRAGTILYGVIITLVLSPMGDANGTERYIIHDTAVRLRYCR